MKYLLNSESTVHQMKSGNVAFVTEITLLRNFFYEGLLRSFTIFVVVIISCLHTSLYSGRGPVPCFQSFPCFVFGCDLFSYLVIHLGQDLDTMQYLLGISFSIRSLRIGIGVGYISFTDFLVNITYSAKQCQITLS